MPGFHDDEFDEIKKLAEGAPDGETDDLDLSYDEIMNEFRYNSATTTRAKREAEEDEARAFMKELEEASSVDSMSGADSVSGVDPMSGADGASSVDSMSGADGVSSTDSMSANDDLFGAFGADESWMPSFITRADQPRKGREYDSDPDEDTRQLIELTKKMREFMEVPDGQARPDGETPPEMELTEVVLGSAERFDEHFRPSDFFAGAPDDDEPEEREIRPKTPSLLSRAVTRLKKPAMPENLTPEQFLARTAPYVRSLRVRTVAAFVLFALLALLTAVQTSVNLPAVFSYTQRPYMVLFLMSLLMILCMLCGVDVLARGLSDLCHLRPGAETLVLFSCLCTLLHVATVVAARGEGAISVGFIPYCAVSAGSVFFAMWGHTHRFASLMRTCKTAVAAGNEPDSVICEDNLWDAQTGFIRRARPAPDFMTSAQQPDIVSRVMRFIAPLLIICCFLFAGLSAGKHPAGAEHPHVTYFFWALSAISCATVPMTTFCAFPFVFSRISRRLSHMGAALAGWFGAVEMNRGSLAVLSDLDLFPAGTMALNGLKALGTHSFDRITAYSYSLLAASGSGLCRALEPLVKDQKNTLRHVSNFETQEGGVSGEIEGCIVLLGTLNFMHRMGIQMPREQSIKNAVYLSINHDLAGIFAVSYIPSGQTEGALVLMERQKIGTVLAVRDFNITPTLLKNKYGVDPDEIEFPVVEDRIELSGGEKTLRSRPAALLTREGLCPYAEAMAGGQRLYRFTLINLMLHLLSLIGGVLLMFFFTHSVADGAAAAISPFNVLLFMLIWWVVTWMSSALSHRY